MKNFEMYTFRPFGNNWVIIEVLPAKNPPKSWNAYRAYYANQRSIFTGTMSECHLAKLALRVAFEQKGAREEEILEADFKISASETFNDEHAVFIFAAEIGDEVKSFEVDAVSKKICG